MNRTLLMKRLLKSVEDEPGMRRPAHPPAGTPENVTQSPQAAIVAPHFNKDAPSLTKAADIPLSFALIAASLRIHMCQRTACGFPGAC